jgi:hypothetical protein
MVIEKHGSKPEEINFGEGATRYVAQQFTSREVEHTPDGKWRPKTKSALRDEGANNQAYRDNYSKAFGHD